MRPLLLPYVHEGPAEHNSFVVITSVFRMTYMAHAKGDVSQSVVIVAEAWTDLS